MCMERTWKFVTMWPCSSQTKPVPTPRDSRPERLYGVIMRATEILATCTHFFLSYNTSTGYFTVMRQCRDQSLTILANRFDATGWNSKHAPQTFLWSDHVHLEIIFWILHLRQNSVLRMEPAHLWQMCPTYGRFWRCESVANLSKNCFSCYAFGKSCLKLGKWSQVSPRYNAVVIGIYWLLL